MHNMHNNNMPCFGKTKPALTESNTCFFSKNQLAAKLYLALSKAESSLFNHAVQYQPCATQNNCQTAGWQQ